MDRRKFLKSISFATTGLLILPSASRIWKPVNFERWYYCEFDLPNSNCNYSRFNLNITNKEETFRRMKKEVEEFHERPIKDFKITIKRQKIDAWKIVDGYHMKDSETAFYASNSELAGNKHFLGSSPEIKWIGGNF